MSLARLDVSRAIRQRVGRLAQQPSFPELRIGQQNLECRVAIQRAMDVEMPRWLLREGSGGKREKKEDQLH